MNKPVKITLITLTSLLVLIILLALGGWIWVNSSFLNFEKEYAQKTKINEMTIDGYRFLDRNGNGELDVYEDDRRPITVRVEDALSRMTIEEKIHLLKGSGLASAIGRVKAGEGIPGAVGTIVATPGLGLPTIFLSDGPAGLRIEPHRKGEDKTYYCTAFPIGTLLASTWNTDLIHQVGNAMGKEALEYGIDVILGPGANIMRHPFCGRNFEYYSEDPLLTGYIGAAMVNGIESNGVGTSVKHFVANNQETNRKFNDVIVSERAMREIYLKGFEIIVKESQPWTIMSSYNKVNGTYTSESRDLMTGVLRNDWGFEGLVMSDWFGGNDAAAMVSAGNDLLEPGTRTQWKALLEAHENGNLTIEAIDTSVKRILKLVFESKKMQNYRYGNNPDLTAHAKITRLAGAEGMVLLKNQNTLPIQKSKNVALLGVTSYDFITGGTGSGDVNEAYVVSLEEGLKNTGYEINATAKNLFEDHKEANSKEFVRPEGIKAMFTPYIPPQIVYTSEQLNQIASESDLAIITIGRNAGEGGDRVEKDDFLLSQQEQDMIVSTCLAFHEAGKKVVVVLNIGGVIETNSWKEQPDAILLVWQGGQEGGNSAADILSGRINPSGKLPMTFPINLHDHASNKNFPQEGEPMKITDMLFGSEVDEEDRVQNRDYTIYEEGIYVGYRHFDKVNSEVSYPFGFGLSYTDFEFSDLAVAVENDSINLQLTVKNIGDQVGMEVIQIYVSKPNSTIDRPVQELKAFAKTKNLESGESEDLVLSIPISELRYWDEDKSGWALEKGSYTIQSGTSSRDIRILQEIEI